MSFTMVVKDEASKIETTRLEDISELSAIIRIAGNINNNINVTIENNAVARRVFKLFKEIYGISPSITVRNKKLGRGLTYILNINNKVKEILSASVSLRRMPIFCSSSPSKKLSSIMYCRSGSNSS